MEKQPESTNSTLFVSGPDISNITTATIELPKTGYTLWRGYYWCLGIKNSIPITCSLYEYIWKVILYIVLIDERRLGLNMWPEIVDQAKSTEDIIKVVWAKKTHCWQKTNETKFIVLFPTDQEVRYVNPLIPYYIIVILLIWKKIWI